MTDDIVTRLREDFCDFGQWENSCTTEGRCPCCLAADEIERLRKERDHYWATTNDAISERNHWVRLFKLAFNSHFDKTWDEETADLLGQAYDEAECICGDDKL